MACRILLCVDSVLCKCVFYVWGNIWHVCTRTLAVDIRSLFVMHLLHFVCEELGLVTRLTPNLL